MFTILSKKCKQILLSLPDHHEHMLCLYLAIKRNSLANNNTDKKQTCVDGRPKFFDQKVVVKVLALIPE